MTGPKPYSAEYYEQLARSERRFAESRQQTTESSRVHLANAQKYEAIAKNLRSQHQE